MNALTPIIASTREDVAARRAVVPIEELERAAAERAAGERAAGERAAGERTAGERRGFGAVLAAPGLSIIAEHKRRSPSAGMIREGVALEDVVTAYERGGAAALSILTEQHNFDGSLDDLRAARAASRLPILRKDFVVDRYQVLESAAAGADAILLIVAALERAQLGALHAEALGLGLDVLVEVHDRSELGTALGAGATLVGINNRDLTTLRVDTRRTFELLPHLPADVTVVSESGFSRAAELDELADAGVSAVLIGEALMRSPEIEAACRALAVRAGARAV